MAFTSGAVWEVETGGSDSLNAGGFDTGVAGFPTDGAATLATSSAPVFTSASYNFVAGDVGAWIYIKSGTNWTAGWYQIASVASNAATLSAASGAGVLAAQNSMTTAAGCATVASPTAATWGIDYSQQASAQITFVDMVIGSTTTQFTSSGHSVGKNFVGNVITVTSGTNFTVQRVAVVSTSGTTATCDKTLGTAAATGGHGGLGGALASVAIACSVKVSQNVIFVKSGTYTISSASSNVSGGCWDVGVFVACAVVGYTNVRTLLNTDTRPLVQFGAVSTMTLTNSSLTIQNFDFDGTSQATSKFSTSGNFRRCSFTRFTAANTPSLSVLCTATANTATVFGGAAILCEAYANTATPFASTAPFAFCLSYNNTGATTDGFSPNSGGGPPIGCVAYNNGRNGFTLTAGGTTVLNCYAEANAGVGYAGSNITFQLTNCGSYNNTGGRLTVASITPDQNPVNLTSTAFNNAAGNDFSLNNVATGGALLRAAGLGALPRGLTIGYPDVGSAQHADPASISVPLSRVFSGF